MSRDNRRLGFAVAVAILGLPLLTHPGAAQVAAADTLTLADAIAIARQANPMLQAARAGATAAVVRIGPAGALPNPELQLGLMNRTAGDFGSAMDPMTMNQLQLMQMVPWPGRLASARRAARHTATAAEADATETERMLVARLRMAYLDVAYADRAIAVMRQTRELLRDFREVSTTMYAVGSGVQQDVLRAQVEVARMSEEITRMDQDRIAAAARLNALLGRAATSPVPAVQLPEATADELPSTDTLVTWAAAEASLTAAQRELLPDLQIGVAWQQRPAFPNMVSLMVGVRLPIFAGARELPMQREARAMRDMRTAELADLRNETTARIIETRARAERDRNLERLYRTGILPQARSAVQAALASYRVGRVNYMTLVDNQMTVNRYETETYRLRADYHQAVGDLEALVGRSLEENR
jgi:cobalt-zinc-cadmium efflux system outer membrane protein